MTRSPRVGPVAAGIPVVILALAACTIFEDNGTHLAYDLERGAKQLRESAETELVVRYVPLGGPDQAYRIEMTASKVPTHVDSFGNTSGGGQGYIVVTGKRPGGTSYHERFVFTPETLRIEKPHGATEVVLHKAGGRIEVVALR